MDCFAFLFALVYMFLHASFLQETDFSLVDLP